MRNGDFSPTRQAAQQDASNFLINRLISGNAETTCGTMTMGLPRMDVLTTLCHDNGRLANSIHRISLKDRIDFVKGLSTAKLVLKNAENKQAKKRIIAFVGSPIENTEDELSKLGKDLKRAGIRVDVVSFGEDNNQKLQIFLDKVNKSGNDASRQSNLLIIPEGAGLRDSIRQSPVAGEPEDNGMGGMGGDMNTGSADPAMDPELAWALEQSRADEMARQEKERKKVEESVATESAENASESKDEATPEDITMSAEDEELKKALQMSMGGGPESASNIADSASVGISEEEQLRLAMEMSMAESQSPMDTDNSPAEQAAQDGDLDPADLSDLLGGLPGVDIDDPLIRDALAEFSNDTQAESEEKEKGEKSE